MLCQVYSTNMTCVAWQLTWSWTSYPACRSIHVLLQRFFLDWDMYSTVLICYEKVYPTPHADVCSSSMYIQQFTDQTQYYAGRIAIESFTEAQAMWFCVLFPTIFPTTIKVTIWAYMDQTHGLPLAFSHPLEIVKGKAQHLPLSSSHQEPIPAMV